MKKMNVLQGDIYGRLTIIEEVEYLKTGRKFRVQCVCGNITEVFLSNMVSGHSLSCGCLSKEVNAKNNRTHGMTKTPEYKSYQCIKDRCHNPNNEHYPEYGGRGIFLADCWLEDFESFLQHIGMKPTGNGRWSVGRIDNDIGYVPGNVRWENTYTQARNRRKSKANSSGNTGVCKRIEKGCVRWVARWYNLEGKLKSKSFSEKMFGESAEEMAIDYRNSMIKWLNENGADYADKHGK